MSITNIKCFLFLVALFVSSTFVLGQKTKVSGYVTDATTGDTLPFVNIMFLDTKIGTTTDLNGKYVLESYYAADSILVSFIGYKRFTAKIQKDKEQTLNIKLAPSTTELIEFVVRPSDENPAHPIVRKIIANKEINNREKLDYFQYEVYNKIELDINNITAEFTESKAFKKFDFIFDNIDSLSSSKSFLPIFISESVSDFYYQKKPKTEKEYIKAAKVSGIENESVAQFTGDMYQKVNIYDNFLPVFGKNFISPISDRGFGYYRYYLIDSMYIDKYWCYEIQFTPKRKGELTVDGTMWINDTSYAIKKVEGSISKDANINFVNELKVTQTFEQVENEVWMLVKDELLVDFEIAQKQMGFYGRKLTSYTNFAINKPQPASFYSGIENIILMEGSQDKSVEYWATIRHEPLSKSQQGIYAMIDTLGSLPIIKTYVDVIQTISTGYYVWNKVELGPYSTLWSYNVVEGNRFRFGLRTSNDFSKNIELSGYAAYGLLDQRIKYAAATRFFITKKPRRMVHLVYKNDVEQVGVSSNSFNSSSAVSFLRRNPLDKLVFNEEYRGSFTREWFQGFSSVVLLRNANFKPIGITTFDKINSDLSTTSLTNLSVSEVSFSTRFAYNEEFLAGEFDRISLGTKYPILSVNYTYGVPNVLGSEYEYHKVVFNFQHKIPMGILGTMRYNFELGKIFGGAPYPLLEVHNGNETWGYSESAFNMMNILEFVSDEYISFKVRQHFDGLFLNKFPLIRKLKWREVVTLTGVYGRLSDANQALMTLPSFTSTLQAKPYLELAAGIENVFKFLRFDILWRMTYLDNEYDGIKVNPIGFRMKFQFNL